MSLWNLLNKGDSRSTGGSIGKNILLKIGYKMASMDKNVSIDKSCNVSPESKIYSRNGKINIGQNSSIAPGAVIQGHVSIGHTSSVQIYSVVIGYEKGKVDIGNYVRIGPHVIIIAGNHVYEDKNLTIHEQGLSYSPIVIEDDVWIGSRVNILAGVTIGTGSVVGAGAVVTKDIPPYSVAVGVPARVIKKRK